MSNKYLICDCVGNAQLHIMSNEASGSASTGPVRFKGKFQEANIKNKNGRMYNYDILERERARLTEVISERRLFGELDHPSDSIIHLENASHLISKLWWDGDIMMGEGEILPTPAGKILETIIRCGIPVGISSRGVGTGKQNNEGIMVIDPSFRLITFDVVADPSTPSAFCRAIDETKTNKQPFYKNETINQKKSQKLEEKSVYNTNTKINPDILVGFIKGLIDKHLDK